jgi:hypothetical protein
MELTAGTQADEFVEVVEGAGEGRNAKRKKKKLAEVTDVGENSRDRRQLVVVGQVLARETTVLSLLTINPAVLSLLVPLSSTQLTCTFVPVQEVN